MGKHKNFHPEICRLLDELNELQIQSQILANDLRRDGKIITPEMRAYSQGTTDAYAYCIMRLRDLKIKGGGNG